MVALQEARAEEWKDIPRWEGYYQVSSAGRIRSVPRVVLRSEGAKACTVVLDGKILACKGGRKDIRRRAGLCRTVNGETILKSLHVHRAVALAFIPNPENKTEVNHINGNVLDCRVENLEWTTREENQRHANENGFCSDGVESVRYIVRCQEAGLTTLGIGQMLKELSARGIKLRRNGILGSIEHGWRHHGYTFKSIRIDTVKEINANCFLAKLGIH